MFPCSQMMREDDHIFKRKDFQKKHEADDTNTSKLTKAPSTSRQWSAFKNPRIVRVSRAFGGKDRHSKVCTVRGLRDRRIRLSVPTAIQLYDLQDRLGLSQPSKVVDWLLDATKLDIDKLPPLQMPPGNFSQFHQPALVSHELNVPHSSFPSLFNANPSYPKDGGTQSLFPCKEGIKLDYNMGNDQMMGKSKAWELDAGMGAKLKGVEREMILDKAKWMRTNERQNQVSPQNFLPTASNSSFNPSLLPYNYYQWDPSNLSLAQFGYPSHIEGAANITSHLMSLPSSLALSSGSQLFLCPPAATPSLFSPYPPYIATPGENETRQSNHFQWLSSNPQHMPPNPFVSSLQSFSSPMSAASKGLQLNSPTDGKAAE